VLFLGTSGEGAGGTGVYLDVGPAGSIVLIAWQLYRAWYLRGCPCSRRFMRSR
jgi:hypothetical protein